MAENAAKSNSPSRPAKAFSCVRCFERKVKCDKESPCAGCVRAGVECIFRVPAPPRRKKKRTQEDILTERLNQYEQILQQKGIDIQNVPTPTEQSKPDGNTERDASTVQSETVASTTSDSDPRSFVAPKLIWEEGRSRYTENNLWTRVTEEFPASQDAIHESSDEEDVEHEDNSEENIDYTLGWTPASLTPRNFHPPPDQIMRLWNIYLENVQPFTMILHRPTMQASLEKAILNLDHLPRGLEVLMFAVYSVAVASMKDHACENTFGESRNTLLARYRTATKAGLARAKFMGTSDVVVLQAFAMHLLAMRDVYDGRTLWTLSGVALRIAEGMGLHKDGSFLGLPPYKTEMRRRLWHQITSLDYRSAELSGSNKIRNFAKMMNAISTKSPLNVNDEDLWPGMTELPKPRQKTTDMVVCCLRGEFSSFWAEKMTEKSFKSGGSLWENYTSPTSMDEHDAAVDELEQRLEEKYVRYCDPSIPIELMASIIARTATNSMRLMAHHPRRWASDDEIPDSERKLIWSLCIRILESYIMCMTSRSLEKFSWHTSFYFQWQALIYLLDCVRSDPLMPEAETAWKHIGQVFEVHPYFITDTKKAINVAVGNLCLKAYSAKEQVYTREGRFLSAKPPDFIQQLRKQREAIQAKQNERKARAEAQSQPSSDPGTSVSNDLMNMMGFEASVPTFPAQQQLPLPPFQVPVNDQQRQQQQQQQSQSQSQSHLQSNQQSIPFWFDSFYTMGGQSVSPNMDWMTMHDQVMDPGGSMSWNQWDYLLDDVGGGAIR